MVYRTMVSGMYRPHEDEVIGVAYNLYVMIPIDAIVPVHRFVQNIEIDIRKERTDDSALGPFLPCCFFHH
jgi:hypothetical protein